MKMGTSRRKGGHNVGQNQILEYLCFKVLREIVITINLEGSDPEIGLSDNEAHKRKRVEEGKKKGGKAEKKRKSSKLLMKTSGEEKYFPERGGGEKII